MQARRVTQVLAVPSADAVGSIYETLLPPLAATANRTGKHLQLMPLDPAGQRLPLPPMHFTIDKSERKLDGQFHPPGGYQSDESFLSALLTSYEQNMKPI
jgi:hypothetical protein